MVRSLSHFFQPCFLFLKNEEETLYGSVGFLCIGLILHASWVTSHVILIITLRVGIVINYFQLMTLRNREAIEFSKVI